VRGVLAAVLFVLEPFLAASLLLRIGPTLFHRDAATFAALAVRIALALASVAAAIGLRESRPYAQRLTLAVLVSSAAFAILQQLTRVLPTSVPPDIAPLLTGLLVAHHAIWVVWLLRRGRLR
jgi:hypothetical protein